MSFNDLIPNEISNFINFAGNILSAGGTLDPGLVSIQNVLSAPKWTRTNPITLSIRLGFYTRSNAFADVYLPMEELVSLSIIKIDKIPGQKSTYSVPGINLGNMDQASLTFMDKNEQEKRALNAFKSGNFSTQLIDVFIPGIIFIQNALVETSRPTFSKQKTESGWPLWGELELNIKSLTPATSDNFLRTELMTRKFFENPLGDINASQRLNYNTVRTETNTF
jgi:hypothetical protein